MLRTRKDLVNRREDRARVLPENGRSVYIKGEPGRANGSSPSPTRCMVFVRPPVSRGSVVLPDAVTSFGRRVDRAAGDRPTRRRTCFQAVQSELADRQVRTQCPLVHHSVSHPFSTRLTRGCRAASHSPQHIGAHRSFSACKEAYAIPSPWATTAIPQLSLADPPGRGSLPLSGSRRPEHPDGLDEDLRRNQ
jgi:hypothetical protein